MTPIVSFIVLADRPQALRVLLAALEAQTEPAWEALILDQSDPDRALITTAYASHYTCRPERLSYHRVVRRGDWGQAEKFVAAGLARGEFVGFPNDDAYYCPAYVERMMRWSSEADLLYCDWVSRSDLGRDTYVPMTGAPIVGHIDVGGFLVRRSVLLAHGWPDRGPTGDGALVESLVRAGARPLRVPGCLYVKN